MAEGLKLVNDLYQRAVDQTETEFGVSAIIYQGIVITLLTLSDPRNGDLWERMVAYCQEDAELQVD